VLEHLGDVYFRLDLPERALAPGHRALAAGPEERGALEQKVERERRLMDEARRGPRGDSGEPERPAVEAPRRPR
jgi:hypothetical protein